MSRGRTVRGRDGAGVALAAGALGLLYRRRRFTNSEGMEDPGSVSSDPLDLHHQGAERVIGLLPRRDCGRTSAVRLRPYVMPGAPALGPARARPRGPGLRHLLLSHIHLDHAGAAGVLVREHPTLQVHVSEVGAPHWPIRPARSERPASLRRHIRHDLGELAPSLAEHPRHRQGRARPGVLPSPDTQGTTSVYLAGDGTLYAGDAAGVRYSRTRQCCRRRLRRRSISKRGTGRSTRSRSGGRAGSRSSLRRREDPGPHLAQLRKRLADWARRVEQVKRKRSSASRFAETLLQAEATWRHTSAQCRSGSHTPD